MKSSLVVFAVSTLVLTGCIGEGKVTGGGWINAVDGVRKANYGFNASSCDEEVKGRFNYHDKSTGMKVNGEVTATGVCVTESIETSEAVTTNTNCLSVCAAGSHVVEFSYDSKTRGMDGSGEGFACMTDGGNGNDADSVTVTINTGPFSGYTNTQDVSGGNIKSHSCPGSNGNGKKS